MSNSASNGKALEYGISQHLLTLGAVGKGSTSLYQKRDIIHFNSRTKHTRDRVIEASNVITGWISKHLASSVMEIERMPDVSIDVADLVVKAQNGQNLRLSIKFNHTALKHARPYSLAQACGIKKKSTEDLNHRLAIDIVTRRFRQFANKKGVTLYSQIPRQKSSLYNDTVNVCAGSINSWYLKYGNSVAETLFGFFVGSGFYKVIVSARSQGKIELQDFSSITTPHGVTASGNGNYLLIEFDNQWKINCRIHTASSKIPVSQSQLSLKFDVQMLNGTATISRLA